MSNLVYCEQTPALATRPAARIPVARAVSVSTSNSVPFSSTCCDNSSKSLGWLTSCERLPVAMKGATPWCVVQAWKRARWERRPITARRRRSGNLWGCHTCRNAVRRLSKRIYASWEDIQRRWVSAYRKLAKSCRNKDRSGRILSDRWARAHKYPLNTAVSFNFIKFTSYHLIFFSRFQLCQQLTLHCDP
jgi:hypothetical protein